MDHTIPEEEGELSYSLEEQFAIIEACLFAAGHPLTYERLADVLHITPAACEDTVEKLSVLYNNDSPFPRGILLVRFPDSCQLCTRESYAAEIKNALGIRRGGKLSQSLLEVLAIAAYNQPVTRAFIDTVRGVDSSYAVGALLEKNLLEACGRLDAPGRPSLYRTTTDFLRIFGLTDLDELPIVSVRGTSGEQLQIEPSDPDAIEQISMTDEAPDQPDAPADSADFSESPEESGSDPA